MDGILALVQEKFDTGDIDGLMQDLFRILFRVGIVGIKQESYEKVSWAHEGARLMGAGISLNANIHIHPAFWRDLGIVDLN